MRTIVTITSAAVLALSAASGATAFDAATQDKGRGGEQGNGHGNGRGDRGGGQDQRGQGQGNGRAERNDDRGQDRGPQREGRGPERAERGNENRRDVRRELERVQVRPDARDARRDDRGDDRRSDYRDVRVVEALILGRTPDRGLIQGCPPGLAKKNNGCLPPGQARQIARSRYDYLWDRRDDDHRYRYDNGYLYQTNNQGGLLGYLPLLGGALGLGQAWPAQYDYQPAPDYYTRYYGLQQDRYDYRYADGVIYGLDRQNQSISQVAALLTGQSWNVGQRMPSGYDVYNVPYQYRDQYADSADRRYRYNDGYVYQVDPTTQLVQAAIQLLT
ncbi:hypothetical protein [Brevundimonas sp.]